MQATMKDGKFVAENGHIPENQEVVIALLQRCLKWADLVLEKYNLLSSVLAVN